MKKILLFMLSYFVYSASAFAQISYIEEAKALGAVSGQGLACGSAKYDTFELLARAIILSKSPSDSMQNKALYTYNEAKANAYFSKQMDGFFECGSINISFDNQDIFLATLYGDGTIKMPDGKIITPRQPYDATMIYKKNSKERDDFQKLYDKAGTGKIIKVKVKDTTTPNSASFLDSNVQAAPQVVPVIEGADRPVILNAQRPYTSSAANAQRSEPRQSDRAEDFGIRHIKRSY